jgi:hypothetical protein
MSEMLELTLSYNGNDASNHEIDLYDVSQALIGFQRTLALTTHLVFNNKIITQAPALKNAKILASPVEEGSWKIKAGVVLTGVYFATTIPQNTVLGHVVFSLYDYVVSESLGFHVDFNKSLGKLYEENQVKNLNIPTIKQYQADSLIEKCSTAIKEIHRPIFKTETATSASITAKFGNDIKPINANLSIDTYNYIDEIFSNPVPYIIKGRISSYNSNTFKGRIYSAEEGRPISFELQQSAKGDHPLQLIIASLSAYTRNNFDDKWINLYCVVHKITSRSGQLKSYKITSISHDRASLVAQ